MKHGTWVVIADGRKMLLLENRGDDDIMDLHMLDWRKQDNPSTRDQGANRPGRMQDTGARQKSAVQQTDWHQQAEDRFAHEVAGDINEAALANRFRHMVLVAPPKALAEIRPHLHKQARARIDAEIAKELTQHPLHEIEKLLA